MHSGSSLQWSYLLLEGALLQKSSCAPAKYCDLHPMCLSAVLHVHHSPPVVAAVYSLAALEALRGPLQPVVQLFGAPPGTPPLIIKWG